MIDLLILIILVEGIVFYIFTAAPLQGARTWFIRRTPFLRVAGDHLLECKFCLSFWVAIGAVLAYLKYGETTWFFWLAIGIVCARSANWIHLVFSLLRDYQIDKRIQRSIERRERKEGKDHAET
jgi:hypothetical protein